jgi:hypothetical protein
MGSQSRSGRLLRLELAIVLTAVVSLAVPAGREAPAGPPVRWEQWLRFDPPILDLAGPRRDGRLVAAGGGRLWLIGSDRSVESFAAGPGGYYDPSAGELYIALSPGLEVPDAGCRFAPDDVFVLAPAAPVGVVRVDAAGRAARFADVTGADFLSGIAFDTLGAFGHRLLVTGRAGEKGVVKGIDCKGRVTTVTEDAPAVEGGITVAPLTFGAFGGDLVGPDERSGNIYAFTPDGTAHLVVASGLPAGSDVGVESAGFLLPGFSGGGTAWVADWSAPGNPHPGTGTVLRLTGAALAGAGARDGDLLVVTEASGRTIAVRCRPSGCSVIRVGEAMAEAHVEGHVVAVAATRATVASTERGLGPVPQLVGTAGAIALVVSGSVWARRRLRRV